MGKAQPLSLLGETNFAHKFGITRIGAQGIHCEVGPDANDQPVMFLACGVEPLDPCRPNRHKIVRFGKKK